MLIKIKSLLFVISLLLNAFFILIFIAGSMSQTSRFSFPSPKDDNFAAAMIVTIPRNVTSAFNSVEINMSPGDVVLMQFSVFSHGNQANLLINAIYDPGIISVIQTGYGIEITALSSGSTLMQALTNDGIRDLALIYVD